MQYPVTQSNELTEAKLLNEFLDHLRNLRSDELLLDFCRKRTLHGTPWIFRGVEDNYYLFRKRIADKFNINFHEVYVTGSAQLGFSPRKKTLFTLDSDIDVALVSSTLYDKIMDSIHEFQMALRDGRKKVTTREIACYHKFLEYSAMGWMRPDLLPNSFTTSKLRNEWFDFFNSLSHGKSEVGNYKVTAGAFKSYHHLEKYMLE